MDHKELITPWAFLMHNDATELFGEIDYTLRSGAHIQQWKDQIQWFNFIDTHEASIKQYYRNFFGLHLEYGGDTINKYYYLEFTPALERKIPISNQRMLSQLQVVIGFILYKETYIANRLTISKITDFQQIIQNNEEYKHALYQILTIEETQSGHHKLNEEIEHTLTLFHRIGWLDISDDGLKVLPAFQRLSKIYHHEINTSNEIQKNH